MKPQGQKRKGSRGEREIVRLLNGATIQQKTLTARRVPLSGAAKEFKGDVWVGNDIPTDIDEEVWEVKRRAQGFKRIYGWLQDCFAVVFRGDRKEWIVCMRLADYAELNTSSIQQRTLTAQEFKGDVESSE